MTDDSYDDDLMCITVFNSDGKPIDTAECSAVHAGALTVTALPYGGYITVLAMPNSVQ